jgi:ferritin
MRNKCLKCGANVLGEGHLCWKHKNKKPLKSSRVTSKSPKTTTNSTKYPQMKEFFLEIWKERYPHNCSICNKFLGNEARTYMFDHLLEKGVEKYKHLAYNKDNISYICLGCHDSRTRGFMPDFYKEEIEKLKIKYNLL